MVLWYISTIRGYKVSPTFIKHFIPLFQVDDDWDNLEGKSELIEQRTAHQTKLRLL